MGCGKSILWRYRQQKKNQLKPTEKHATSANSIDATRILKLQQEGKIAKNTNGKTRMENKTKESTASSSVNDHWSENNSAHVNDPTCLPLRKLLDTKKSLALPPKALASNTDERSVSDVLSESVRSGHLENIQRRRLSVSTVTCEPQIELTSLNTNKSSEPASTVPSQSSRRGPSLAPRPFSPRSCTPETIEGDSKHSDLSLELFSRFSKGSYEITITMLLKLLKSYAHSLLIFGAPSRMSQKGFENKKIQVAGSLAPLYNVTANGIGYACKKGLKPESPNQDDFFIIKVDDWTLYGVFDGHGPYGHKVSSFTHMVLPYLLIADTKFETDPLFVMEKVFQQVHRLLEAACDGSHSEMDCSLSGTTATLVLHRNNNCYVAHVGDSRTVLGSRRKSKFKAIDLTEDHKPTLLHEIKRIEGCGGEIRRLDGDIPFRVFVKNKMYPGLAMSRAIGDTVGTAVGVVSRPDVNNFAIRNEDQFLILASDGVWEFISSQEAVDIVGNRSRKEVQKAAEFLALESWRRWIEEEENIVDDVTCLVIWLDHHDKKEVNDNRSQ